MEEIKQFFKDLAAGDFYAIIHLIFILGAIGLMAFGAFAWSIIKAAIEFASH
ncbi:MAG: hypothetical protein K2F99_05350 [Muribaculaceae bacterium]|nr:hypothetical protein [Muribaculaceae bacterium]